MDRLHDRNTYFVALKDGEVKGLIAANASPPYSVEGKLADRQVLSSLTPPLLEVRLLALDADYRGSCARPDFSGLFTVTRGRRGIRL